MRHVTSPKGQGRGERKGNEGKTNDTGLTAMINVHQIRIEIQMLVLSHLNRGVGRFLGLGAWWEGELGEESVGWEGHGLEVRG